MSKAKPVMVCCPHCHGAGRIPLTGVYLETLEALKAKRAATTGAQLGREMGVPGEATNNRLARLEDLGLATSERYGRERRYLAAKEAS